MVISSFPFFNPFNFTLGEEGYFSVQMWSALTGDDLVFIFCRCWALKKKESLYFSGWNWVEIKGLAAG